MIDDKSKAKAHRDNLLSTLDKVRARIEHAGLSDHERVDLDHAASALLNLARATEAAPLLMNEQLEQLASERWMFEDFGDDGYGIITDDGYTVCEPSPMDEKQMRLIMRAPVMLEFILRVLGDSDRHQHADNCRFCGKPIGIGNGNSSHKSCTEHACHGYQMRKLLQEIVR